jgi:peroxiredoxin
LRGVWEEIRRLGAELYVIGNGTSAQARDFRKEFDLPFPLYVDPGLRGYRAGQLRRGVARNLGLTVLAKGFQAYRRGFRQGRVEGDPWQLGGVFVIGPGDKLYYTYRSGSAGDHPESEEFLSALPTAPV